MLCNEILVDDLAAVQEYTAAGASEFSCALTLPSNSVLSSRANALTEGQRSSCSLQVPH